MEIWTPSAVAARLEEAASVLKRLPEVGPQGHHCSWPTIIREFWEGYGWDQAQLQLGPPPADAIHRMDETMTWLQWLDVEQKRLVWSRAERIPWKVILTRLNVSRATAWRVWTSALTVISTKLNLTSEKC